MKTGGLKVMLYASQYGFVKNGSGLNLVECEFLHATLFLTVKTILITRSHEVRSVHRLQLVLTRHQRPEEIKSENGSTLI